MAEGIMSSCKKRWMFLCALNALPECSYISYDTSESNDDADELGNNNLILTSQSPSQEEVLIKKSQYLSLSDRAKEVVEIITMAPSGAITKSHKNITIRSVSKFLRKTKRWTRKEVKAVFIEIENLGRDIVKGRRRYVPESTFVRNDRK